MLKNFKINKSRDTLYPSIQCYQMPLIGVVNEAINDGTMEEVLPSWSKFVAQPMKSEGFFKYMLQAIFDGKTNSNELKVNYQLDEQKAILSARRIAMMFMPGNTRKDCMLQIESIAKESLPNFEVVILTGATTTNRKAEARVKEALQSNPNKSVLIIAAQMAQRSFSIPEITELYLAYDNGDNGATVQKMSRTLTPSDSNKVGRVFSLSFDPNRDDKFDSLILGAALSIQKKDGGDIKNALAKVLMSVDIFKTTQDGPVLFENASFIEQCLQRKAIDRVLGKTADISKITDKIRGALANGKISVSKLDQVASAARGKTREFASVLKTASNNTIDPTEKELAKVREMITTIIENIDFITDGTETDNIIEALKTVREWGEEAEIEDVFGVSFDVIEFVFEQGIINQNMINIKLQMI